MTELHPKCIATKFPLTALLASECPYEYVNTYKLKLPRLTLPKYGVCGNGDN